MRSYHKLILLLIFLALVAGYFYKSQPLPQIPQTATAIKAGALNLYPDPKLTPGDVLTTDKNKVCASGYSKSVRNVPIAEKKDVYREYGVSYPEPQGSYEVDHFISLELGGSNDIKNLWPEPAEPIPGFHQKDVVENYLHEQVCNGSMTLEEAQKEIASDWYKVYLAIEN